MYFLSKVWTLFHFYWYVQLLKHVTLTSETYICEQCLHCCLQTRFKPEGCNLPGFDNCSPANCMNDMQSGVLFFVLHIVWHDYMP